MRYRKLARSWIAAALVCASGAAWSQAYPTRPITLVVPLPAGGTADVLARIAAEQMRNGLGQPVVVENRPGGAGGLVGAESVFKAPPDGYTLLCAPQLTFSIANVLNPKLAFDTRAFEPVSVLAAYPAILLAKPELPVANTAALIAHAKANPGKLNYGSQGKGQIGHLFMEQLMHMAKVEMVHVPFRGSAPAITALVSGQIDLLPDLLPVTKGLIESGKLKLLATGGTQRLKAFPNVPTVAETLPGFEADTWMGIVAPPGTPKDITRKISDAIGKAFRTPEVNARIAALHVDPLGTTPEGMAELIRRSAARWTPLIEAAKIKFE
ncbi:MAG TPA: tripartite tricarboxylate transporter substrate binding protein [Xanthobacteraceae bacterium]|nr:tripartite tricarboxylate transporter substrate binding protein [Xanthobacteraceae bacterium]